MSAHPLVDPPAMPTMVSRLPKFSSRPKSATASSGVQMGPSAAAASSHLTNGFYHHPGPVGVNGSLTATPSSAKQNGFIRVPTSISMKWRKENGAMEDGETDGDNEWREGKGGNVGPNCYGNSTSQYCSQRQQGSPGVMQHDTKKPTVLSAVKARFSQPVMSSPSLSSPQSSPRTLSVSKPSQPVSELTNGTKHTLSGHSGSKPRNGSLRRPQSFAYSGVSRPGSGSPSGSPLQKKVPASRSQSSDETVRQPPSTPLGPSSTSRAAEQGLKEPTASSVQAPASHTLAKSPVSSQTLEGGGKGGGIKVPSYTEPGLSGVNTSSLLPPSVLKKPLIPSLSPTSKPSGISYKLSRPSLFKQSRPLRVTSTSVSGRDPEVNQELTEWRNSVETPSTTETSPESLPEAADTEGLSAEPVSQTEVSVVLETLEDMSLSSTSSLDRNDTSQEYMDDFDNLGNGGVGMLLLSSKNDEDDSGLDQSCARFDDDKVSVNGVAKVNGALCFLDDGVDWTAMRLTGERETHRLTCLSHRRRSSQPDFHDQGGSSLDLSPSDSCGSGGTYMWDEEGLEPLGSAAIPASINTNSNTTHHIGSFDSDLNSIDLLNNLDSCDLDDDDLMLDADLAEDTSLHSDGDTVTHMAQWRMRQLCWGMQDVHNDNDGHSQCYKLTEDPGNKRTDMTRDTDLFLDFCPPRSPCLSPGAPGLGLDVEELAEDCSAVRSQLEFLRRLLQQEEDVEDDTLTTDTVSPEESSHSCDSQVQALLQEVQQLRQELRSRDRTIAQLTLQLTAPGATTRCQCQEMAAKVDQHTQTSVMERESVASQTPWKEHFYQRSRPYRGRPRPSIPSHLARKRVEKLVLYFSDTACHRYFTPPARMTRNH
ncbi:serine-rich coiled-coil domain-containing protein 2-like isoform X3 [Channa argus]|uniref:serine-rich coiled-coil domain-containing protein 2-like isoform X3 n=1 Tax=Channa argus TaxID=215402 RepID=UPI0035200DAE